MKSGTSRQPFSMLRVSLCRPLRPSACRRALARVVPLRGLRTTGQSGTSSSAVSIQAAGLRHSSSASSGQSSFSSANLLFPWLHLESYVPPAQLRERITAFASQAAVLYALLGGVSVTGLLCTDLGQKRAPQQAPSSALPLCVLAAMSPVHYVEQTFGSEWAREWVVPLYCVSAFCNLQGLLSSMFSLAHANAMPDAGLGTLVRRHTVSLHATGWLLVPAVVSLAAALVCTVDLLHGEQASRVALVCAVATGALTTCQMASLHAGGHAIRRSLPKRALPKPGPEL